MPETNFTQIGGSHATKQLRPKNWNEQKPAGRKCILPHLSTTWLPREGVCMCVCVCVCWNGKICHNHLLVPSYLTPPARLQFLHSTLILPRFNQTSNSRPISKLCHPTYRGHTYMKRNQKGAQYLYVS